jgi:lysophospholipase L1-like esterase
MALRAQKRSINVILCSLLPASQKYLANHAPRDIMAINQRYRAIADAHSLEFVDFYSSLADEKGQFSPALTVDGLHPSDDGYSLMTEDILPILAHSMAIYYGSGRHVTASASQEGTR